MDEFTFSDNRGANRYELLRDGVVAAHADYRLHNGEVIITHTEVLPGNEGQGIGTRLARMVVGHLRGRGAKIVPRCDFMASYIARHPEGG